MIFILGLFFLSQIGLSFHLPLNLHSPILIEGNDDSIEENGKIIAPVSQKEKKPKTSRKRKRERVEIIDEEHEFIRAYNNDLVFEIQGPVMGVKGVPEHLIAEARYELADTSANFLISANMGVRAYITKHDTLSSFNGIFTIGAKKRRLIEKENVEIDETTFKTVSLKAIYPISPLASPKLSLTIQHANLEEGETSQGSLYTWKSIYGEIEGGPSRISPRLGGESGSVQEDTILGELEFSRNSFLGVDIGKKLRPIFGLRWEFEASNMFNESTWSGYLMLEKEQLWTSGLLEGECGLKGEFTLEGVIEGLTKSLT